MKRRGSFTLKAELLERLKRSSIEKKIPMSQIVEVALEDWLARDTGRSLRAGVVGLGHWGEQHCRVISEIPSVELSSVCDLNPTKKNISQKYGAKFYQKLDDMLARPLDLVFCCVSIDSLAEVSLEVCERGINCIVEKPFGKNLDEVKELAKHDEAIPELVELQNGAYIALKENLNMLDRLYASVSFRIGAMPRRDLGVSCLWYFGPYDFSIAYDLFGAPREIVKKIDQDYGYIIFDYGNMISQFYFDWRPPIKIREISVFGENGTLNADFVNMKSGFNNVSLQVMKEEPLKKFIINIVENLNKKSWMSMSDIYKILKRVYG
jgi:predicted dehydrogenase